VRGRSLRFVAVALAYLAAAGCRTGMTLHAYEGPQRPRDQVAVLKWWNAPSGWHFFPRAVDGKPTNDVYRDQRPGLSVVNHWEEMELEPGEHTVVVAAQRQEGAVIRYTQDGLPMRKTFEAGRVYETRGDMVLDMGQKVVFRFDVVEATPAPEAAK
jgi:hypothetical protein